MPGKRGKPPYRLLLDAGVYVSHPHNDHVDGMEYLALTMLFNPGYTPEKAQWLGGMFIADKLYHNDSYPEVPEGMFYGVLKTGDCHVYPAAD